MRREILGDNRIGPTLKKLFGGVYIANEKFTQETAEQVLKDGEANAVAFGKLIIANPDLVQRFASGAPLSEPNPRPSIRAAGSGMRITLSFRNRRRRLADNVSFLPAFLPCF